MFGPLPTFIPSQDTLMFRSGLINSSLALMLCNARAINNKTRILYSYFAVQNVDLACLTEALVKEGKMVTMLAPSQGSLSSITDKLSGGGGEWVNDAYPGGFLLQATPILKITGTDCIGLVSDAEENLAICLMY